MTWLPLSREGKFHRMRDGMLYHDAPEYYSGPKFLAAGRGSGAWGASELGGISAGRLPPPTSRHPSAWQQVLKGSGAHGL